MKICEADIRAKTKEILWAIANEGAFEYGYNLRGASKSDEIRRVITLDAMTRLHVTQEYDMAPVLDQPHGVIKLRIVKVGL